MLETVKTLLANQYEAVLSMLKAAVDQCPDTLWHEQVASYPYDRVVFHTLFFTDLYLGFDHTSFLRQPFHLDNQALFAGLSLDVEPFEDPAPRRHDKASLLAYLEFCRRKAAEAMAAETEETLTGPEPGPRPGFSRAELHVYNIRHVHHHAAQLGLRLRLETGEGVEWVGSGWHEAAQVAEHPASR
jgi:hypothetical protein